MENVQTTKEETPSGLCAKFLSENPGMSQKDFEELRKKALSTVEPGARKFYIQNGVMEIGDPELFTGDTR
jgi:hypothetical protein